MFKDQNEILRWIQGLKNKFSFHITTYNQFTCLELPVKIRVLIVDRFQKAVTTDATTFFLWVQLFHVSINHSVMHSAA